jgi:branched-chain amino acid transport system substrate-binding protein
MWRGSRMAALIATGALAIAACGSTQPSGTSGPFKIGFESSLTGFLASYGQAMRTGFNAEIDAVNASGGADGHHIDITYSDDTGVGTVGASNYIQLVTGNNVLMVAGVLYSEVCDSEGPDAAEFKVPLLCYAAAADTVIPPKPYVFSASIQYGQFAQAAFTFAKTVVTSASPRVAIINVTGSGPSVDFTNNIIKMSNAAGWNVVSNLQVDPTNPNISAQLAQLTGSKPDLIFEGIQDPQSLQMVTALKAAGLTPPIIASFGTDAGNMMAIAALNGSPLYSLSQTVIPDTVDPSNNSAAVNQYIQRVTAQKGNPTAPLLDIGYAMGEVVVDALDKCGGSCTAEKLAQVLGSLTVSTSGVAVGAGQFSAASHELWTKLGVYQYDSASQAFKVVANGLQAGPSSSA